MTLNIVPPGTIFGPRIQQIDVSFAKRTKVKAGNDTANIDIFNVRNRSDPATFVDAVGPSYQQATNVIRGRYVKFSVMLTF